MSTDRLIHAAYAYLYIGDFQQAKAAFERAANEHPERPEPLFLASITALRSGMYDEAERLIRQALCLSPLSTTYQTQLALVQASAWNASARAAYIDGHVEEALLCCQNALDADPQNDEALQLIADIARRYPLNVNVDRVNIDAVDVNEAEENEQ